MMEFELGLLGFSGNKGGAKIGTGGNSTEFCGTMGIVLTSMMGICRGISSTWIILDLSKIVFLSDGRIGTESKGET